MVATAVTGTCLAVMYYMYTANNNNNNQVESINQNIEEEDELQ